MKLTTSNVATTNVVTGKIMINNTNAVGVGSIDLGDVSVTPDAVSVGSVVINTTSTSAPSLVLAGVSLSGGFYSGILDYQELTANGVWYNPYSNSTVNSTMSGYEQVFVMAWGGGGGASSNNTTIRSGGGGACVLGYYSVANLPATVSVTVGPGGTSSRTTTSALTVAGAGGNTSFGSLIAYGGGGAGSTNGGDGGGTLSGGGPLGGSVSTFGGGTGVSGNFRGGNSVFGGGGGVSTAAPNSGDGGISIYGGGGGGGWVNGGYGGPSEFGGNGGSDGNAGGIPGGGGTGNTTTSNTGGRGEVRVWTFGMAGTTLGEPTYTLAANTTTLYESDSVLFTVSTTNVPNNTVLHYTLNNSSTATSTDFSSAVNGAITILNNSGTFTLTANNDADSANQAFQIDIRTGSTTGPIVASNGSVSIIPAAEVTYTDSVSSLTSETVYTFSGRSLGTASSNRYIIVTIGGATGNRTISSVTIAGVTATEIGQATGQDVGSSAYSTSGIYIAAVPTGTTGDVVVTFSSIETGCGIGVYAVTNLKSATPVTVVTQAPTTKIDSVGGTLTTKPGGFVIATVATKDNGVTGWSWTNATQNYSVLLRSTDRATAGATATTSSDGTVTVSAAPNQPQQQATFVAASFQ